MDDSINLLKNFIITTESPKWIGIIQYNTSWIKTNKIQNSIRSWIFMKIKWLIIKKLRYWPIQVPIGTKVYDIRQCTSLHFPSQNFVQNLLPIDKGCVNWTPILSIKNELMFLSFWRREVSNSHNLLKFYIKLSATC